MARAGGENFPVASRVLPRRVRSHLLAVYGFARLVDELGDSAPGDRLAALEGSSTISTEPMKAAPSTCCYAACSRRCASALCRARRSRA